MSVWGRKGGQNKDIFSFLFDLNQIKYNYFLEK